VDSLFVDGHRLEIARIGSGSPTLVLLHEGLGCVGMWRDFPSLLASKCALPLFAFSRRGYGGSDPIDLPRPLHYMEDEARALPALLDAAQIDDAILVGHSDGASIALIQAGSGNSRIRGLVLIAPHVFCEDLSVASITHAREQYEHGDLRPRLQRWHGDNVDCAFWGWNRAWLDPDFRRWNIEKFIPGIGCPILIIQGQDDPYGTIAQLEAIERAAKVPVTRLLLPRCGHSPHRNFPSVVVAAIADFARTLSG
jgi:pimeloyl-ACP methyl ester carboxylesterase